MTNILQFSSVTQVHDALGLEKPEHPLVSVIPIDERVAQFDYGDSTYVMDLYQASLKSGIKGTMTYGRNTYDFEEGMMVFTRPGQAMSFEDTEKETGGQGWILLFHPDLIRKSTLGQQIENYSFFSYETHEALHLSDTEKQTVTEIAQKIVAEYRQNIDRHSQKLIVSNIELLLNYCTRYYDRQFYVRTNMNKDLVTRFEHYLDEYLTSGNALEHGLPTVKACAGHLNMSPSYLSDLLKKETGKTAQQHIQYAIVDRAKFMLLGSAEQVSQIAYGLGFEYPQHFSKVFKKHTGMSPAEYRRRT